jgi:hypothetical protein
MKEATATMSPSAVRLVVAIVVNAETSLRLGNVPA